MNMEISISIIAALLTIVGYSLNDTIVIYDRIRENMLLNPYRDKKKVFNTSLNQTLNRTLVTSITTLIVVIVLYIYGGDVLRPFSFALIIGIILGTYSSIFIASPITLYLEEKYNIETEEN
jgi:SecD/SecF fusion protein